MSNIDPQFYSASMAAWYNTALERDKGIFTLSAGAIGLLVTLLVHHGATSVLSLVCYVFGLIAFVVSLGAVIWIFHRNRRHLEHLVNGETQLDETLTYLDRIAVSAFALGAALTALIGITTAVEKWEKTVKNEPIHTPMPITEKKSFNGAGNMIPKQPVTNPAQAPAEVPKPAPESTAK